MAFQNRRRCYVCDVLFPPRLTCHLEGEKNMLIRDIAVSRRDDLQRPPLIITPLTRLCKNCMRGIRQEINLLENDPLCVRLNVLTQTSSNDCLICNGVNNIHRLTLKCRVDVIGKKIFTFLSILDVAIIIYIGMNFLSQHYLNA